MLIRGQRCLCAYCETRIAEGISDAEIEARKAEQRVEHFHPKEDVQRPPNWALHWPNLWAVCHGGSDWPPEGEPLNPDKHVEPLRENLSCDAFKNQQIESGKLHDLPDGWILSPAEIPAFPLLFEFSPDGAPEPHKTNCQTVTIPANQHPDTKTIVAETIRHLNLGCPRLNRMRSIARAQLEKRIEQARKANPGKPHHDVLLQLARRVFPTDVNSPWPQFFTLLRWRLRDIAEQRLNEMGYTG
jgi:uncharacterized protein (TIGR02646 family)